MSAGAPPPALARRLGALDGALITIGSVIGTGIFLTGGDVARAVPDPALILLVWVAGGLVTLAGALTYAELGVLIPRAGGLYDYLRAAYGPVWGFFYGWASLLVIMSGGIAAIAVGFGEYAGSFVPLFSSRHTLLTLGLGGWHWAPNGAQLAAVLAILAITTVNHFGVRAGATTQNLFTAVKIGATIGLVAFGFLGTPHGAAVAPPAPAGHLIAGFGVGMIAALWTYDGWYGLTFSAGEMRNPGRTLPVGIITGTLAVVLLYVVVNAVYLRALPVSAMMQGTRTAEDAAAALFGATGARLVSMAVVVASFGCLASTILYSSRIYQPMAADGAFFRGVAAIHPRYQTPTRSLWLQSAWAMVLALSGSYTQLFTWVTFAVVLFHVAVGAAVFVLRSKRPDAPRPYRVWGYPLVPALFIAAMALLLVNTLAERPVESLLGLGCIAAGWPAYLGWRRRASLPPSA